MTVSGLMEMADWGKLNSNKQNPKCNGSLHVSSLFLAYVPSLLSPGSSKDPGSIELSRIPVRAEVAALTGVF